VAVTEKNILNRLYFIAGCMFLFMIAVIFKLFTIQFVQGDQYRDLAEKRTIKNVVIPANRGNVYASDGSLLATSIPKYDIRLDAITPSANTFEKYLNRYQIPCPNFLENLPVFIKMRFEKPGQTRTDIFCWHGILDIQITSG
jgi:cell division protein FtsI/penicillin-binding protein 2